MSCQLDAFDLLDIENEDIELSFSRYFGILLSERACSGVPRIFERLFLVVFLLLNEL